MLFWVRAWYLSVHDPAFSPSHATCEQRLLTSKRQVTSYWAEQLLYGSDIDTPRHICRYGDMEAVEDFLAVGKDVNMQDAEGRTPLHYAAAHDNTRIAQALVDAGADLEVTDTKNNTALHYACGYGRLDVVDILLRGGANVSAENGTGKKPIDLAKLNEQNPVLQDAEIVGKLGA
jgi:ankyrin repeat protein